MSPSAISLLKSFIEQISNDGEGEKSAKQTKDGAEDGKGSDIISVLSRLAIFIVEYMGIPIEELEDSLDFTDIVKLCRIGQKAPSPKEKSKKEKSGCSAPEAGDAFSPTDTSVGRWTVYPSSFSSFQTVLK